MRRSEARNYPSRRESLRHISVCSVLLLLCCALTQACARHAPRMPELRASSQLLARYGEVTDARVTQYVAGVAARLGSALSRVERRNSGPPQYQIHILAGDEPFAYAPGGGLVLLSAGLIGSVGSESELAFILAHEFAHEELGHPPAPDAAAPLHEYEIAADRFAVALLALAGYDPRRGAAALRNAYGRGGGENASSDYPDLVTRIRLVEQEVAASGWRPPGTIDRREFREVARLLRQRFPRERT